ncbi:MAG TPA: thiamine diphosphokinase [Candidatus Cloacimonadota bacterium]|nr:thiamine diphosphokinase [Candidatus Cloacimonadota bacterium]HPT72486.1 thiamine diphosphokinase [Candidatus Cloacimonadota bacterium]
MKKKIAYLFTHPALELPFLEQYIYLPDAIFVGVDAGTETIIQLGRKPDVIIGDLDSLNSSLLHELEIHIPVVRYPEKKNETDSELAILWCLEQNVEEIVVFNTMTGRFDHVLGLLQNLLYAKKRGIKASIETGTQQMFFLQNQNELNGKKGMKLSLIPFTEEATAVRTENLEFPLCSENLYQHQSRGISNEFSHDKAKVSFEHGELLAILTH